MTAHSAPSPRLLFFCHSSEIGGAEKSLLTILAALKKEGYALAVVIPSAGAFEQELKHLKIPALIHQYYWWCSTEKVPRFSQARMILRSLLSIFLLILRNPWLKPDVVITNTLTIPWGIILSRILHKPHIMLLREFGTLDFGFQFFLGYEHSLRYINAHSQSLFTNSQTTLKYFKKYIGPEKLEYIYPSVSASTKVREVPVKQYFSTKKRLRIVNLGTIFEIKGQMDAVKAVRELIAQGYEDIELILAGRKESHHYYERLLAAINEVDVLRGRIRILEFIEQPLSILREADVVLVCSRYEAFGRVTAESMALKKPVIATRSGANLELVQDGVSGFLYNRGNYKELAEEIAKLYSDRSLLKKMGQAGYENYTERLAPKMKLDPLLEKITELTSKK